MPTANMTNSKINDQRPRAVGRCPSDHIAVAVKGYILKTQSSELRFLPLLVSLNVLAVSA